MTPKVLFVLTSQDKFPANGKPTGWFLPEFAHPYHVLKDKTEIVIASPKGGLAPLDPSSVEGFKNDPLCADFLKHEELWSNTVKLGDVLPKVAEFAAVFYVGGHGPMYDLHYDPTSLALIQSFAEAKKPVSAVCHGPTVFLRATSASGQPLLTNATVTGFSNVEEDQAGLSSVMPYMLEDELNRATSGQYVKADQPWGEKVVISKAAGSGAVLITGQNPASASGVGKEILKALGIN